jgi:excisionase family DNA binding protein
MDIEPISRFTRVADLPEMLRVEEVAAWAQVGKGTIYEALRRGDLPHVRLGRLVRIPRSALAEWAGVDERGVA